MLPQMMPLPWLFIFFLLFFCFYSINFFFSFLSLNVGCGAMLLKKQNVSIFW